MKKIVFFIVIAVFSLSGLSYADVWVVHDKGKVHSLSEANDAVVPQGCSVDVIKGKMIPDLGLTRPVDEYKFDNKAFKPDTAVIKAKEDALVASEKAKADKERDRQSAVDKLKALGLTDAEIQALIGG